MNLPSEIADAIPEPPTRKTGGFARIGILLILVSGVLWFSLFAIPFLPLTLGQKAMLAGAEFVGVQICWWVGAAMAGPHTVKRIKSWLSRSPASTQE